MVKEIEARKLRIGMFLCKIETSWINSPFWKSSFLIEDQHDIDKILSRKITKVWIDTSKGLDVEAEKPAPVPAPPPPVAKAPAAPAVPAPVSLAEEKERAAIICANAKKAVTAMFGEARMGRAIKACDAMPLVEEISQSVLRNSDALIGLVRLKNKDDYTYMHSVAVCALMIALARQLKLDEEQVRQAGVAGLLHDIGKMAIPNAILNKPGALTDDEFKSVRAHPQAGYQMLVQAGGVGDLALDVCLHHHEKMDGSGYPHRLAGDAISLFARMGAVCDVYDALTSNRAYKAGWCPSYAILKMGQWKGHFDDKVFQAFVKGIGIYPVGTLVRLESGRLAVVLEQSGKSLLMPRVQTFFSTKSMTYIPPQVIDLALPGNRDKIVSREKPETWSIANVPSF